MPLSDHEVASNLQEAAQLLQHRTGGSAGDVDAVVTDVCIRLQLEAIADNVLWLNDRSLAQTFEILLSILARTCNGSLALTPRIRRLEI